MAKSTRNFFAYFVNQGETKKSIKKGTFPTLQVNDVFACFEVDNDSDINDVHCFTATDRNKGVNIFSKKRVGSFVTEMKNHDRILRGNDLENKSDTNFKIASLMKESVIIIPNMIVEWFDSLTFNENTKEPFMESAFGKYITDIKEKRPVAVIKFNDENIIDSEDVLDIEMDKFMSDILEDAEEPEEESSEEEEDGEPDDDDDSMYIEQESPPLQIKSNDRFDKEKLDKTAVISFEDLSNSKCLEMIKIIRDSTKYSGFVPMTIIRKFFKKAGGPDKQIALYITMGLIAYIRAGNNPTKLESRRYSLVQSKSIFGMLSAVGVERTRKGEETITLARLALSMPGELLVVRKYMCDDLQDQFDSNLDPVYQDLAFQGIASISNMTHYETWAKEMSAAIYKKNAKDADTGADRTNEERWKLFEKSFVKWQKVAQKGFKSTDSKKIRERFEEAQNLNFTGTVQEKEQQAWDWIVGSHKFYLGDELGDDDDGAKKPAAKSISAMNRASKTGHSKRKASASLDKSVEDTNDDLVIEDEPAAKKVRINVSSKKKRELPSGYRSETDLEDGQVPE